MNVSIVRYDHIQGKPVSEDYGELDKVMAANEVFPFWALYSPPDATGELVVHFFAAEDVKVVTLRGKDEAPSLVSDKPVHKDFGDLSGI